MFGYIFSAIFVLWLYYVFFYKARLKVHTFTRSDKRVVFIEMIHIGSKDYYDEVRSIILQESWQHKATYLYERIQGTPEQKMEAFLYVGSVPLKELYEQLANTLKKQVQPQDSFVEAVPRSINADLHATKMIEEFKKRGISKNELDTKAVEHMKEAPPLGRFILRVIFRNLLKFMALTNAPAWFKRNKLKDEVAVVMRDEYLYNTVMETPGNIVITYGAGHYSGFKKLMGGWKVTSYKLTPH